MCAVLNSLIWRKYVRLRYKSVRIWTTTCFWKCAVMNNALAGEPANFGVGSCLTQNLNNPRWLQVNLIENPSLVGRESSKRVL
jgi:hypothetical protein